MRWLCRPRRLRRNWNLLKLSADCGRTLGITRRVRAQQRGKWPGAVCSALVNVAGGVCGSARRRYLGRQQISTFKRRQDRERAQANSKDHPCVKSPPLRGRAQRRARIPIPTSREPEHFFRETLFGTQFCLKSELLGEFDGPRARRWYLTDGGHFENTGAYELLRRQLEFIVILDNGADPELTFGDIANLIRLVRVDFGIEITVSSEPPRQPKALRIDFADVARSFHEFAERTECIGVRLITTFPNGRQGQILVIKPRLTAQAPPDVWEYQQDVPSFPQESTADQFFDDVQWESHRALGESQAKRLFPHSVRRTA
jgi:hypothetical protein